MKASFPTAWGILGKHPSQADFVRSHATGDTATELHRYLEQAVELLARQKQALAFEPLRFLFAPKATGTALLGLMRPSVDKVGRHFPLAVFLEVPLQALPSNLAEVALFGASSFAAVRAVLAAEAASKEAIDPKVQAVSLPDPAKAMAEAREAVATQLAATTVQPLHALFADGPTLGGHWYAVRTVLQACDARRKVAAGAPTLDVPLSPEFGVVPWLSLVTKGNPGSPPPSMMWSSSRLFVGLGPLPVAVVQAFAGGPLASTKVWPLTTSQQTAVDGARAALRSVPDLAKPETTFDRILSALVVKA